MSKEMWDFEEDGELFFEKAVNGFLPDLFQRWKEIGVNHVVSIVLFSRIFFKSQQDANKERGSPLTHDGFKLGEHFKDFYKVIVDWETRTDWNTIIKKLKKEYDAYLHSLYDFVGTRLAGVRLGYSSEGNLLEAVNLALNPFDKHYVDRDLLRTGLSIVVVSPGSCAFHVSKDLLRMTNERMIDNGIAVDIVCLSKPPLHSVPLFRFYSKMPSYKPPVIPLDSREDPTSPPAVYHSTDGTHKVYYEDRASIGVRMNDSGDVQVSGNYAETLNSDVWDPLYYDDENPKNLPHLFYCVPFWMDASFYASEEVKKSSIFDGDKFLPRCKLRELQMGCYLQPLREIQQIPYLNESRGGSDDGKNTLTSSLDHRSMENYEEDVFNFSARGGNIKVRSGSETSLSKHVSAEVFQQETIIKGDANNSAGSKTLVRDTNLRMNSKGSNLSKNIHIRQPEVFL
jgi:hypothetical protein